MHWVGLAVRPNDQTVIYYDSLPNVETRFQTTQQVMTSDFSRASPFFRTCWPECGDFRWERLAAPLQANGKLSSSPDRQ